MPRRTVAAASPWRAVVGALAVLAGAVACAGIITGPDAPDTRPRSMRVSPSSITVARGDTARLIASLFDATGAPAVPKPGVPLTYLSSDTAVARVDAGGLVTGVGGGSVTVRGVYGALTLGVPVQVTVRPRIVVRSGAAQTAEQGDSLAEAIVVRALDEAGQPLAGVTVDFVVLGGGGAVVPSSAQTDGAGDAQVQWILGTELGTQSLRAQRTGSDSAIVTATATAGTRVRRVDVTALRTTLAASGDTTQLLARAYNVVDSLLPAASFQWTSSDTMVAVVSASGLVTSRAAGSVFVRAASGGFADSVAITVQPAVANGVRHWTGAVSDEWTVAANWLEGSAPIASDSIVIPATGVVNLPRIRPGNHRAIVSLNAGPVLIDGDGALFVSDALVFPTGTLAADCTSGAAIVLRSPTVETAHPLAGRLRCSVNLQGFGDRVLVDSLVLLGSGLGLQGEARLTLAGHVIDLGDQQLHVSGNARLEMLDPADRVRALFANLGANGQGSMFAAGELHLRQGLAVIPGAGGFVATGTHRVVLESPVPSDTATLLVASGVRFRDVELRGPTKLEGTFTADGDLVLLAGARLIDAPTSSFGLPQRLRVEGDLSAAAGATTTVRLVELGGALSAPAFSPDTLALVGTAQVLPLDGTVSGLRSVRVSGTATARVVAGTRRFLAGDLVIDGDFGLVESFTAAMGITGSLRVTGNGILRLGGVYSSLRVEGNALFDGRAMNGELAQGDLELYGDLVQRATTSPRSLVTGPQFGLSIFRSGAIDFATPDSSMLGFIEHAGNLTRTLRSDLTLQGQIRFDLNNVTFRSDLLGAGGTRRVTARGLDLGGVTTVRNVAFRVLDGSGLDLTGGPTFADFDPAAVQLEFVHSAGTVAMDFASFQTQPTGAGRYLRVSDPDGATGGTFTVNVSNVTPATHGGFAEAVAPAVINGWPSGVSPRVVLTPDSIAFAVLTGDSSATPQVVTVANAAPGALVGLATEPVYAGAVSDWLAFAFDTSGTPALMTVSALPAGLPAGTHTAQVIVMSQTPGAVPDTLQVSITVTGVARLVIVSGDSQVVAAGQVAPDSLKVRLVNAFGQPVGDAFVSFAVSPGGGSLSPTAETTDNDGYVATAWTAGATPGLYSVTASRNGFASATFSVEVVAACDLGSLTVAGAPPTVEGRFCPTLANPPGDPNAQGQVTALWNERYPYGNGSYFENLVVTYHPTTGAVSEVSYFLSDPTRSILWYCAPPPGVPQCSGVSVNVATRRVVFDQTVLGQNGSMTGALTFNGSMPIAAPVVPVIGVSPDSLGFAVTAGSTTGTAQTVTVSNIGQGTLSGLEVSVLYGPGASDWLFASIDAAMPATLTVTPLPEFLAAGSYRAIIEVTSTVAGVAPETVVVTIAVAPAATTIALDIAGEELVGVGLSAALDITLGAPAPAGGLTVTVASDDPARVGVAAPGTVFIAAGQSTGTIVVNGLSEGSTTLRATAAGYSDGTLAVVATNRIISLPSTLNVPYGLTTSLPIQLATPAPPGGLTVALASSDPSRVGVTTSTVFIPAGATLASGSLSGVLPGSATITATAAGWVSDTTNATTTLALDLFETSVAIDASFGSSATVAIRSGGTLIAAPAGGVAIGLIARNAACVNVPATVTVSAGATQVAFPVTYGGSAPTPCATWVVATAPNAALDSMTVNVSVAPFLTVGNLLLGAGTQIASNATLASANYGTVTVRVESLDPGLVLVAPDVATVGTTFIDVPVSAPSQSISFHAAALEGVTGTGRVVVTAPGFVPDTALVTVRALGIEFISAPATLTSFSPNSLLQLRVGALNVAGTAIDAEYGIRAGGTPITVTVANTAPAVGRLVTSALTAQSVTSVIPVGSSRTPTSLPAGSIEFDPLAAGATQLLLTAPGITSLANATWNVNVTAPGISVGSGVIGAGTQASWGANLGAGEHGGVTVRVESSDSSLIRIAPNGTTLATGALDFPLANGGTGISFFVAAMEGVTGTATLTVSASGFTTATSTLTVRALGIEIISAPTNTTTFSTNTAIQLRVGGMNVAGTAIDAEYPLRFGGTPITVTLANGNAAVGQLVTSGGPSQSAQATIPVGTTRIPTSLAGGGVDFDPVGAGTTVLSVSAPGIASLPNAAWNVTVTAPNLTATANVTVGAGMQVSAGANLGASDHGGVTVRVESSDPSRVLLAPDATSPAVSFLEVPLANGQTSVPYYVVAPENVTGTATLSITAPGFNAATTTVAVRALGVEVISAPTNTTSLSPSTLVQLRVGYLNAAGTNIEGEYPLRFNGTPITVTVANTNATVGRLVSTALTGQSVTTVVPVGTSRAPTSVATGGVEFDPLSTGTTSIVVSAPGLASVPNSTWPVTVTTPAISAGNAVLGSGMQLSTGATLGASDFGTVTVHVESSDPSLVRVAPDGTTLATASIDVAMTAPSTSIPFHIAALEGVTGTATITISAPGFTSATYAVVVRGIAVEFISAPTTIGAAATNFLLQARVGYLNATGTTIEGEAALRFGGTPITLTLTNSNAAAAQLLSSAGTAQQVTAIIPVGSTRIPTSIPSGAVEFDPLASGSTTITVSAPGLIAVPNGTRPVTVTP